MKKEVAKFADALFLSGRNRQKTTKIFRKSKENKEGLENIR